MPYGVIVLNNPLIYTDPTGNIALIDDILIGAAIGAIIGGVVSAATGTNILTGMVTGAISGAFFGAAGGIVKEYALQSVVVAKVGLHTAAGAMSGGINAAIIGGDSGLGALTGGIAGGLAAFGGGYLKNLNYPAQVAGRSLIGAVSGGIAAEIYGGDFWQGFGQGALTAGIGAITNDWLHDFLMEKFDFIKRGDDLAKQAFKEAQETGKPGLGSGEADAWRHSRWNQLMAKEMGPFKALIVSIGHEVIDNGIVIEQTWQDFKMDIHNNIVGAFSSEDPNLLLNQGRLTTINPYNQRNYYNNVPR